MLFMTLCRSLLRQGGSTAQRRCLSDIITENSVKITGTSSQRKSDREAYADQSGEVQGSAANDRNIPGQHSINHAEELVHMPDTVG